MATRSCFRSITPYVLVCFLLTGCYRQSIERGTFDPSDPEDYIAEVHLKNGQKIKGTLLAETNAYVTLSVKEAPDEIKQAQAIPLNVSENR